MESTQAHNKYIYAYSEAVVEYRSDNGNIPWNDTLSEAFEEENDPYNSYVGSLIKDASHLDVLMYAGIYSDANLKDVDFLSANFSTWSSAKGIIGVRAGGGAIDKGVGLLEKIWGLLVGFAR